MRQLQQTLRSFSGRGISLRIEYKNKLILSGAIDALNQTDINALKTFKPLLVLMLPEGNNYSVEQILESLRRAIEYSDVLIIDAGYELHSADLRALPVTRSFFSNSINS